MATDANPLEGVVREWSDLVFRLQQLTRNDQGATIVKATVLCIGGKPAYWFKPEKTTIEPAASARAFCDALDVLNKP